jgi:hypothetical protein
MLQAGRSRVRFPLRSLDIFNLPYPFQPALWSGFDSTSYRNAYQESSWVVKGDRRVRLTASPLSVSRLSKESVGTSTACYRDSFNLFYLFQNIWPCFTPIEDSVCAYSISIPVRTQVLCCVTCVGKWAVGWRACLPTCQAHAGMSENSNTKTRAVPCLVLTNERLWVDICH